MMQVVHHVLLLLWVGREVWKVAWKGVVQQVQVEEGWWSEVW